MSALKKNAKSVTISKRRRIERLQKRRDKNFERRIPISAAVPQAASAEDGSFYTLYAQLLEIQKSNQVVLRQLKRLTGKPLKLRYWEANPLPDYGDLPTPADPLTEDAPLNLMHQEDDAPLCFVKTV